MTRSAPLGSNQTGNGEFTLPLAALETMPVGLLVVPGQSGTIHANAAARALLGTDDAAALPFPVEISLADDNNPAVATMQTPANGTLKLTASRVKGGGAIIVVEDNRCQIAYRQAESEYRSLVENAVCGIYRDRLDGTPLRANPALAALNGYETEAEYLAALSAAPTQWYVDAARGRQFREMMAAEGRVRDFVSEVYRHRTNEKVWITENAWYVCDAEGKPLFIEGTIQDATERVQGMTVMERQANIDALTGAASRYRFLNHLNELTQSPSAECVLLTIDLDNFKDVNDLLGHAAGDALLKTVAARLQSIVGGSALVARLGGDEFAVLLSGRHCHMEADIVALKIVNALREPVAIGGHNALVAASVGVAIYPAHASNAEELLTHADFALYQVKAKGRNGFRLFDHELKLRMQGRKALEAELNDAISAGELELHYQPIVKAGSAVVSSYEALMRWNHPRRGFLMPGQFIQIAEDAGMMTELGNWAIRQACQQAAQLPPHIKVAVNVSPNQFRAASILDVVEKALHNTGLDASRLILELTESVLLSSESIAAQVMDELQKIGVQLALDDFGTGYSSLSYLQRYNFSEVKIDRSFVAGISHMPANLAIVRAIIGLTNDLGIDVVAEGIETAEQAAILKAEGCGYLQGYLYGKPCSFADTLADHAANSLRSLQPKATAHNQIEARKRSGHNML